MGPFTAPPLGGPLLPKLRGYFAEFLNEVSLARLGILVPSHLCRFAVRAPGGSLGAFLVGMGWGARAPEGALAARQGPCARGFACARPPPCGSGFSVSPPPCPSADPVGQAPPGGSGVLARCPIAYALRPRLRSRLTPGGRTCPGKPRDSGGRDSHPPFRYSCPHNRWAAVHRGSRRGFAPAAHAPLPAQI